jgi:hypothetical protein
MRTDETLHTIKAGDFSYGGNIPIEISWENKVWLFVTKHKRPYVVFLPHQEIIADPNDRKVITETQWFPQRNRLMRLAADGYFIKIEPPVSRKFWIVSAIWYAEHRCIAYK